MSRINLIFDFDGTVADTGKFMLEFANQLLGEKGYPKITPVQLEELRKMTIIQGMRHLKIPLRLLPKAAIRARQLLHDRLASLKPCPGMIEALQQISRSKGVTIGMVSSNSRNNINAFIKRYDLTGIFDFIDVGVAVFGKHLKLKQSLKKHHLEKSQTFYVGDEIRDIEAAKKTGLKMISVTWGLNHEDILQRYSPEYLIEKPSKIVDIVSSQLLLQ